MKKLLLSVAVLIAFAASVFAQKKNIPGAHLTENYAIDDFSRSLDEVDEDTPYSDLYWWASKDTVITIDSISLSDHKTCVRVDRHFKYDFVRSNSGGYQLYTISQPYGKYEPVGVGFGEGKFIDLSPGKGDANIRFQVENLSSRTDLSVRVALQDTAGNQINAIGGYSSSGTAITDENVFEGEIKTKIPKRSTIASQIGRNKLLDSVDYSVPHTYSAVYTYPAGKCNQGVSTKRDSTTFKWNAVAGVTFTFVNFKTNDKDGEFKPFRIDTIQVKFTYFSIGTREPVVVGLEEEVTYSKTKLAVYPNPIKSGNLELGVNAKNVRVVDAIGNIVFVAPSASTINVDGFKKGLYLVQSTTGSTRFVVE